MRLAIAIIIFGLILAIISHIFNDPYYVHPKKSLQQLSLSKYNKHITLGTKPSTYFSIYAFYTIDDSRHWD